MCGECVLNVKSGEPDHRDDVLTDEERAEGAFTICVSRSQGPMLELDI
jgi:vanillate O-demethylase ferredoxin subunit